MESLESLKTKLVREINESSNRNLLLKLYDVLHSKNLNSVAEKPSIYETEKPMTDEEVEDYFKEEVVELSPHQMKMLKKGLEDVEQGRVYSEEEMDKMDDEWLN